jgi:hypothetical protein
MERKMKSLKTASLLGIFSLLVGFTAPYAHALPANEIETNYYTDATYTNEAGYTFLSCQGSTYREGKTSLYRIRYQTPCSTGGSTRIACFINSVQTTCPADICGSSLFVCR